VVGVRFKPAGKIYYFDSEQMELQAGEAVIVETIRGVEYGEVAIASRDMEESKLVMPLKKVVRKANQEDETIYLNNKAKEKEALEICKNKVREHKLPMRLIDVEYTFDMGKVIFYFTAESRVDFRELVKDLASIFKTRIELRQIGVRDEAKMLGGIGTCGRILCCNNFLGEFEPVSIRMAKEQNLSLNPTKISGICGRLMCCLKYESELYDGKECKKPEECNNGENDPGIEELAPGADS
jgi:cell fate regulator YaaT (PSP1 superfamily)